jgi:hypothetical protein
MYACLILSVDKFIDTLDFIYVDVDFIFVYEFFIVMEYT